MKIGASKRFIQIPIRFLYKFHSNYNFLQIMFVTFELSYLFSALLEYSAELFSTFDDYLTTFRILKLFISFESKELKLNY